MVSNLPATRSVRLGATETSDCSALTKDGLFGTANAWLVGSASGKAIGVSARPISTSIELGALAGLSGANVLVSLRPLILPPSCLWLFNLAPPYRASALRR